MPPFLYTKYNTLLIATTITSTIACLPPCFCLLLSLFLYTMQQQQIYPTAPAGIADPCQLSAFSGQGSPQKPKSVLGKVKDKAKSLRNKLKNVTASNVDKGGNQESETGNQEVDTCSDSDDEVKDSSDENTSFEQVPFKQLRSIGALGSEKENESAITSADDYLAIPSTKLPLYGAHGDPNLSAFKSAGPPDTLQAVPTEYGNYRNIPLDDFGNLADTSHITEGIPNATGDSEEFSTNVFQDKDEGLKLLDTPSPVNAKSPRSIPGTVRRTGNAIFPDDIVKPNPLFGKAQSESERSGEKVGVPNFEDYDKEQSITTPPLPESEGGVELAAAPNCEEEIRSDRHSKADQGEGRNHIDEECAKYICDRRLEDNSGVTSLAEAPISTRCESASTRKGLDFKGHPVEVSQIKLDESGEELSDAKLDNEEIQQYGIVPVQDSLTGSLENRDEVTTESETEGDQHYEEAPTDTIEEDLSQYVVPQQGSSPATVHDSRLGSTNLQSEPQSRELKVEAQGDEGRDIPVTERAYDGLGSATEKLLDATAAAASSIGAVAGLSCNNGGPTDHLQGGDKGVKESRLEDKDGKNWGQWTSDNVSKVQEIVTSKIGTRAGDGDGTNGEDYHDTDGEDIVFSTISLRDRNQMEQPEDNNSYNEGNQGALTNKITGTWLGLKDSVASKLGYGSPTSRAESTVSSEGDHVQDDSSQHQFGTPESLTNRNADEQQQPRSISDKTAGTWVALKDNVASKLGYGGVTTVEGTATDNRQHAIPREGDANNHSPVSGVSGRIELKDTVASKLGYGSTSPRKVLEDQPPRKVLEDQPQSGDSSTRDEGERGRGTLLGLKDAIASQLGYGDSSTPATTTAPAAAGAGDGEERVDSGTYIQKFNAAKDYLTSKVGYIGGGGEHPKVEDEPSDSISPSSGTTMDDPRTAARQL